MRTIGMWEACPRCKSTGKDRWLFKVKVVDGKVWLCCSGTQACGWKIEITGPAAQVFQS
jgi:hypothetical protein